MTQPLPSLKTVLWLRLVSLAAFPLAAGLMAISQRSPLALALLAAAMLAVSLHERRRLAGLAGVPAITAPGQILRGFAVRLGILLGVFVLALGIFALFRDTSLARQIGWPDLALLALPAGAALAANEISARMASRTLSTHGGAIPPAFRTREDGVILEGEIIDDEPEPPR